MDPRRRTGPERRYEFRIVGLLSERARGAFGDMDIRDVPAETVISGVLPEDGGVQEVLSLIQSLGLRVVSVHRKSGEQPG